MSESTEPTESPAPEPPSGLERYLPPLGWLPAYASSDLARDALAGLLVAVLLVPQAMAYAMLAELPPQAGLYAAMVPPLLYAALGTSRFLCVGPVALVSLLAAEATGWAAAGGGEGGRLAAALVLAVMIGVTLIALGALRLGFVANFLSNPVLTGFTAGAAILIAASQLGPFLGLELERGQGLFGTLSEAVREIGDANPATAGLGAACLALLLLGGAPLTRLLEKTQLSSRLRSGLRYSVPLLVTAAAIAAVRALDLAGAHGVATVGELRIGLPIPTLPSFEPAPWRHQISSALSIALVAFVIAVAIAKSLASRRGQRIEPSQEMIALGAANLGAGLTGGCPVGGSVSRSALAFDTGAVSPLAQAAAAAVVLAAGLTLGPLLADLPRAALAAIILSAVVGMIDVAAMRRVLRISRFEALTLAATLLAVVGLGVQAGIAVGAVAALVLYLYRTSQPRIVAEGYDERTRQFHSEEQEGVEPVAPPALVLRIDESLYFGNSRYCEDQILEAIQHEDHLHRLVLDLSAVGEIDSTALEMLSRLARDLEQAGIEIVFSEVLKPVEERMERAGLVAELGRDRFFDTTKEAVESAPGAI